MRLVICRSCGRLSEHYPNLAGMDMHACACVPDHYGLGLRLPPGIERFRELDKAEQEVLKRYVAYKESL